MSIELTDCPNCNTKLKGGFLGGISLLSESKTGFINLFHDSKSEYYCTKCGNDLISKYKAALVREKGELSNRMQALLPSVPVISIHSPLKWDYDIIGMVSGQSTTGTGVFSEFSASISDLFGEQADSYNRKLKAGEILCFSQVRIQAIQAGANAIVATDIDYAEVGGDKGMLMVCVSGTAVRLNNIEILGQERGSKIEELDRAHKRLNLLKKFESDL